MRWDNETFEDVQPGDLMTIVGSRGSLSICKVERVTKTQIVMRHNQRFRRDDGSEIGGGKWSWNTLERTTDAHQDKICRSRLLSNLLALKRDELAKLPTEILESAYKLLSMPLDNAIECDSIKVEG